MKRLQSVVLLVCFAAALFAVAQQPQKSAKTPAKEAVNHAQQAPPILDRELFFGNPEIAGAQLSPNGKYITFLKPWKDTRNIWIKGVDEPFSAARLLTTETKRPIPAYFWTYDSKYVLFVKDNDGDENFNVFAVDPTAKPAAGTEAPPSRDLTGLKGIRVIPYELPKKSPDTMYIGINDRDKAWHDLYKLTISTGEKTLLRKNTDRITSWIFDLDGNLRLATRSADSGDTEVLRVDPDKLTKIYSCNVFETCQPLRFQKGNKLAYMETNKGDLDLIALTLLDPATGETTMVETDPLKKVDFAGAVFSDVTDELIATVYPDDQFIRRYFKDKTWEADHNFIAHKFPGMELGLGSRTLDENVFLFSVYSDTEPGVTYMFDRRTKKMIKQYSVREKLPRTALAPMKVVHYPSSDGLMIPAYLTIPKGASGKNLPVLVTPHGGPWARDVWGYNTWSQYWANRGYVVLQPNFRGSTGYGKKFLDAGNLEWGRLMQDDITWGVKYLEAQGIADPKHVGIMGGSYGGYATLAGVTFTPDLYAAAVDYVGPSNLATLIESIPPYWEAGRKTFYKRMGDPTTEEGKKLLHDRSPLFFADKIKTPLLVVQGANDPRVNKREADQIVIALRDRGFPVEYIVAPDEGHGFARPQNNLAMYMAAEKFLAAHLGGRYQEGGSAEATKRLAEITVDPKNVVLAKKVDTKTVGVPKLAADLAPGTYKYKASIAMGAQQVPLTISTTIVEQNGAWLATDNMETPQGKAVDAAILEKGTLVVRRKYIEQGPVKIDVDLSDNKASGKMNMGGQERPIAIDLGGPLFADGGGYFNCLAALPLADGYETAFRNIDVMRQKEKVMNLKVVGAETVTVPAGSFDAYKVEITSDTDKQTLWVAKDSHKPVKVSAVLANMGGAVLTMELAE